MTRRLALCLIFAACAGPAPEPPPYAGAVAPGDTVSLSALVSSIAGGAAVTWSVDSGGGTITSAGLYTAPTCAKIIAGLPVGTDLTHTGQLVGTEHVTATWSGGSLPILVTVSEAVTGVSVAPTSLSTTPGATQQFSATVHYSCHDQTTP